MALFTELPETQQQAGTLGKDYVWWKEQSCTFESYKLQLGMGCSLSEPYPQNEV